MAKPIHFYLVFNPMLNSDGDYPSQAHEFYHQLKRKIKEGEHEKAFMYWGKIKANDEVNSQYDQAKEIWEYNLSQAEDTHLYITDFHHFWVAKIEGVKSEVFQTDHTLPFYDNKEVDLWFKITDMDLLSSEFEETSSYLKTLYISNQYSSESVEHLSPSVGNLKFPVAVQDSTYEKYFKNTFYEDAFRACRYNALIENPKFSGDISTQVKSFVLPPYVYSKLPSVVKSELLCAETKLAIQSSTDKDMPTDAINSYLRILESLMNETFGEMLRHHFGETLYISSNGAVFFDHKTDSNVALADQDKNISIGAFCSLFSDISKFGNLSLSSLEENYPDLVEYFVEELRPFIIDYEVSAKRVQFLDHSGINIDKREAYEIRNFILGVGCEGVISKLTKYMNHRDIDPIFKKIA